VIDGSDGSDSCGAHSGSFAGVAVVVLRRVCLFSLNGLVFTPNIVALSDCCFSTRFLYKALDGD